MKAKYMCLLLAMSFSSVVPLQAAEQFQGGAPAVIGGMESTPKSKARIDDRRNANAKIKPVDINTANEKQLKKLPGISDAEAKRIIANRPYGSKVWLVTNGVIGEGPYTNIKHLIVAKQPTLTVEEGKAYYEKLKSQKAAKP